MTIKLNPLNDGLSPQSVEELYNIVVTQKLSLIAKLDRIEKELAVAICAIDDGKISDIDQIRRGLKNLIEYKNCKVPIEAEFDFDLKSIDLVKIHVKMIADYHSKKNFGQG